MIGRAPSSCNFLSISHTILLRFSGSASIDCWSNSLSSSGLQYLISVLKKRVGTHEDTIREFRLTAQGLQVGEPLTDFQGIMSGIPTYVGSQPILSSQ